MDISNKVSEITLAVLYSISSNVFDTYVSRVQRTQKLQLDFYSTNIFLSFYKIELYKQINTYFINHKKLYYFFTCCFTLIRDFIAKIRKITLFGRKRTLSPPIKFAQNFTKLNLNQNIITSEDLSFFAKGFFASTNLKLSNEKKTS